MMDKASLEPVLAKLNELHAEGRLLAGVVVQRADAVKVVPLAEAA